MTSKSKGKGQVRDVQEQTGWPYQHTLFLVQQLGYGPVSEAVDACPQGDMDALRRRLGDEARAAQRAKQAATTQDNVERQVEGAKGQKVG
jgi:hypothetical protein